jgi:hypothetical protein
MTWATTMFVARKNIESHMLDFCTTDLGIYGEPNPFLSKPEVKNFLNTYSSKGSCQLDAFTG